MLKTIQNLFAWSAVEEFQQNHNKMDRTLRISGDLLNKTHLSSLTLRGIKTVPACGLRLQEG